MRDIPYIEMNTDFGELTPFEESPGMLYLITTKFDFYFTL